MRDMLKDLYASISEKQNNTEDRQAGRGAQVHAFCRRLDSLDDVMKILQKKDASPDLISSAFRTARYLIDKLLQPNRRFPPKLLQYQKDMPGESVKCSTSCWPTVIPRLLDMMEKSYKRIQSAACHHYRLGGLEYG